MIKYFCDRCGKEIVANRKSQTIEYIYDFPEPTDEEIQKEIDAAGLTEVVNTEDVRKYIRERLYVLYCEVVAEEKNANDR
jgi:hypothetical protein